MAVNYLKMSLTFTILLNFYFVDGYDVITSPVKSVGGGLWGQWEFCQEGTYATAFQMKKDDNLIAHATEEACGAPLTGIKLYCNPLAGKSRTKFVFSSIAKKFGKWREVSDCNLGVVTGFQLRINETSSDDDNSFVNHVRLFCTGTNVPAVKEGSEDEARNLGTWTNKLTCGQRKAICGIRTLIRQNHENVNDESTVNNVEFACCDVQSPAQTCDAKDSKGFLITCNNVGGNEDLSCTFPKTVGVYISNSSSAFEMDARSISLSLGFSEEDEFRFLSHRFIRAFYAGDSHCRPWLEETKINGTFDHVATVTDHFVVKPGWNTELHQSVGECGIYSIRGNSFRTMSRRHGDSSPSEEAPPPPQEGEKFVWLRGTKFSERLIYQKGIQLSNGKFEWKDLL